MKVAIVSLGRSHLLNLARMLDQKEDVEVVFYTMMPKSRCRMFGYYGKVRSLLFPIGIGEVIIGRIPKINPYKRSSLRFKLRKAFDRLVAAKLKYCDVLIGLNGCAVKASRKAKSKYNAITICDQGSSHIKVQDMAHYSYSDKPISQNNTDYMLEHYDTADYLMAPARYVIDSDIKNNISKERILYNPYGVDLKKFHTSVTTDDKEFDVIMVGSWWKHKGCDMLADACLNILKIRLLHVGAIVDCELPDNPLFKHIPFVPEQDLPQYYHKAKLFAMPSIDEGFGLVLLQAVACGIPIVGSNRTGTPDIDNLLKTSGLCYTIEEPLNVSNIAKAISLALSNRSTNLRQPADISDISWEAYGNRYYNILKNLTE